MLLTIINGASSVVAGSPGVVLPDQEFADGFLATVTGYSIVNQTSVEIMANLENTNPFTVQVDSLTGFASIQGVVVATGLITPDNFSLNPQQSIPIIGIINTRFNIYQAFGEGAVELPGNIVIPLHYDTTEIHIEIDITGPVFGAQLEKAIIRDGTLLQFALYGGPPPPK